MLDPFSPVNPAHVTHIQSLLDNMHEQFIEAHKGEASRVVEFGANFEQVEQMWFGYI